MVDCFGINVVACLSSLDSLAMVSGSKRYAIVDHVQMEAVTGFKELRVDKLPGQQQ